jgi:hypothetical protein
MGMVCIAPASGEKMYRYTQAIIKHIKLTIMPIMFQRLTAWFLLITAMNFAYAEDEYRVYMNERYGYSIQYPASLIPQGVSDSGDGQVFLSKSKDAELRVFAQSCIEGWDEAPAEYISAALKEQKKGLIKITYQTKGKNYAVLSGYKDGKIFYNKLLIDGSRCTQFTFHYPEMQRARYDAATAKIAASFKR